MIKSAVKLPFSLIKFLDTLHFKRKREKNDVESTAEAEI